MIKKYNEKIEINTDKIALLSPLDSLIYCVILKNINDKSEIFVTTLYYVGKNGDGRVKREIRRLNNQAIKNKGK